MSKTAKRDKGRPPRVADATDAKAEKARLKILIAEHDGNLSAMARAEDVGRQTLAKRLAEHGLEDAAALARFKGGISGARSPAVGADSPAGEREKAAIERALRTAPTMIGAAEKLGITRSALYRKLAIYKIDRPAA